VDGLVDVLVRLEPHQLVDAILRRETAHLLRLVLPHPAREVIGDADIQRSVAVGREDVDEGGMRYLLCSIRCASVE